MKLWIIRSIQNLGYDAYDSAVVAAETAEEAKNISPDGCFWKDDSWWITRRNGEQVMTSGYAWTHPNGVTVEYLGETDRDIRGPILSSFNAG